MTFEDSGMPGFFLDHTSEEEVLYMEMVHVSEVFILVCSSK